MKTTGIKVVVFDADDTLWGNEHFFQETETKFCALLEDYLPHHTISQELFKTEMQNIGLYGYGIKSVILSMIETAINISSKHVSLDVIEKIIGYGKELLEKPVELMEGVEETLQALKGNYRLVVATKGDLLDQERKLKKSGISHYFHHIEIMSDKQQADYIKLIKHLDVTPGEILMVGNSIKSDILPVLEIGGHAIHIPYHTTWAYEVVTQTIDHPNFIQVEKISEILPYLVAS